MPHTGGRGRGVHGAHKSQPPKTAARAPKLFIEKSWIIACAREPLCRTVEFAALLLTRVAQVRQPVRSAPARDSVTYILELGRSFALIKQLHYTEEIQHVCVCVETEESDAKRFPEKNVVSDTLR